MPNIVDFLSMLFFPPPTRFLNARSGHKETSDAAGRRRETPRPAADPTDEEYVCCFCEYDLFFGSDQAMDKAVRRRKKVLERRQKAQEKAKGVMAGKGLRGKSKSTGGDGGESDDDERCAGGEKCRCAEMRAQAAREDADSRGIEDTGSEEGDDTGWVGHAGSEDGTEDCPRDANGERHLCDSTWIGANEGGEDDAGHPARTLRGDVATAGNVPTPLPVDHSAHKGLPEVDTFDVDEVEA